MTNPVSQFRNGIFGSRGCNIQEAIDYVNELINTLTPTDQVGIRVGFGVLVNTIDNAVAQSQGPKPIKDQADLLIQLSGMYDKLVRDVTDEIAARDIALIDERIAEHKLVRADELQSRVMDFLEHDDISDQISDWMSNNFDIDDYDIDSQIENWVDNNLDEKVSEAVGNLTFSVTVS
jgi:hypothetical protein